MKQIKSDKSVGQSSTVPWTSRSGGLGTITEKGRHQNWQNFADHNLLL